MPAVEDQQPGTPPPADPPYPLTLSVDYPDKLSRLTTFFRFLWIIPIGIIAALVASSSISMGANASQGAQDAGFYFSAAGVGVLFLPVLLMIVFRKKYPRWWFDWNLNLARFLTRVGAYALLLRDDYPSTDEEQAVHLDFDYPDTTRLHRLLPIVKWFLAIPHYFVLFFLWIGAWVCTVIAWFAILFTGRYPRGMFDYVVGVVAWSLRVQAYAVLLITDKYPPFSLSQH